jgi:hypothetical protein
MSDNKTLQKQEAMSVLCFWAGVIPNSPNFPKEGNLSKLVPLIPLAGTKGPNLTNTRSITLLALASARNLSFRIFSNQSSNPSGFFDLLLLLFLLLPFL